MKHLILTLIMCLPMSVFGQTKYCSKYLNEVIINKTYITISFNTFNNTPNYVGETLLPRYIKGNAERSSFINEYNLKTAWYTNSGFDRGHMAPAANYKFSQKAMNETFCMTNISPQLPKLNRTYWKYLEDKVRDNLFYCDTLWCVTGTIYSTLDPLVIKDKIIVPDYFYKAILGVKNRTVVVSCAWIYENNNQQQNEKDNRCSIKELEAIIHKKLFIGVKHSYNKGIIFIK